MRFDPPLTQAHFIQRRKRFFADVVLEDGTPAVAHLANTGSMRGLLQPGAPALLRPLRGGQLVWSLEGLQAQDAWVGVNTHRANAVAAEVLQRGVAGCGGAASVVRREVTLHPGTRVDFVVDQADGPVVVEVKSVTLAEDGLARFPDAPTERGQKHLRALLDVVRHGGRAMALFMVLRSDARSFAPAPEIDPVWAGLLSEAMQSGVSVAAVRCVVGADSIEPAELLPVIMPA